jgi:hypothetical protein
MSQIYYQAADGSFHPWIAANGVAVVSPEQLANERNVGTANQYGVAIPECNMTLIAAGVTDSAVSSGVPAILLGIIMHTSQTGALTIKDGATTICSVTPGANVHTDFHGGRCETSLVITTAASAACTVLWRPI